VPARRPGAAIRHGFVKTLAILGVQFQLGQYLFHNEFLSVVGAHYLKHCCTTKQSFSGQSEILLIGKNVANARQKLEIAIKKTS
jgi:hypothetical protein